MKYVPGTMEHLVCRQMRCKKFENICTLTNKKSSDNIFNSNRDLLPLKNLMKGREILIKLFEKYAFL